MRKFCVTSHLLLKFVSVQVVIPEAHLNYNGLYSENFVDRVVLVQTVFMFLVVFIPVIDRNYDKTKSLSRTILLYGNLDATKMRNICNWCKMRCL